MDKNNWNIIPKYNSIEKSIYEQKISVIIQNSFKV